MTSPGASHRENLNNRPAGHRETKVELQVEFGGPAAHGSESGVAAPTGTG
jgi:hypothetical protein